MLSRRILNVPLNTKRSIQGNRFFLVFKAKIFCRKLNRIVRMVCIHVNFQTLCPGVVGRFDLNGNQFPIPLDYKINFSFSFRFPIVGSVAVGHQLHIYIVFCHAALEVVKFATHIENVIRTDFANLQLKKMM